MRNKPKGLFLFYSIPKEKQKTKLNRNKNAAKVTSWQPQDKPTRYRKAAKAAPTDPRPQAPDNKKKQKENKK